MKINLKGSMIADQRNYSVLSSILLLHAVIEFQYFGEIKIKTKSTDFR